MPQAYNPAIVALSAAVQHGLGCDVCAFAAAVRVDWMTQCAGYSRRLRARLRHAIEHTVLANRKVTLLVLLDLNLAPLVWGWLQVRPAGRRAVNAADLTSLESLDAAARVVDVRLFVYDGRLWATGTFPNRNYDSAVFVVHTSTSEASTPKQQGNTHLR